MSEKKDKKKKINPKYIPKSLSAKDKKAQIKSIKEGKDRPKVKSFQSKKSKYIIAFEKKYGYKITDKRVEKEIISKQGINEILAKGKGAYYSSGSRPNQTATSWALARLASVIMNGPARKVDIKIWNKYKK